MTGPMTRRNGSRNGLHGTAALVFRASRVAALAMVLVPVAAIVSACGSASGRPASTPAGCARSAVAAVRRQSAAGRSGSSATRVVGLPRACRGLGAAQLGQAVTIAVSQLSMADDKAIRRRLAYRARTSLAGLVAAAQRAASRQAAASAAAAARRRERGPTRAAEPGSGTRIPLDGATLVAWLLTAASGAMLIRRWVAAGGLRRPAVTAGTSTAGTSTAGTSTAGTGPATLPRPVIVGHFGLALSGLAIWASYLATGWHPLAWTAVGVLLPVVGLGMATLMTFLSGPHAARAPALLIAAHGTLATVTMLLALLAAVATVVR